MMGDAFWIGVAAFELILLPFVAADYAARRARRRDQDKKGRSDGRTWDEFPANTGEGAG